MREKQCQKDVCILEATTTLANVCVGTQDSPCRVKVVLVMCTTCRVGCWALERRLVGWSTEGRAKAKEPSSNEDRQTQIPSSLIY